MSENYKTIKELADELGVSKQAVQRRINNLPKHLKPKKINGKFVLTNDLANEIRKIYSLKNTTANAGDNTTANAGDNMTANAGDNMTANAGDNMTANAGDNMTANAGDNTTANAGDNMTANAGDNMTANAGDNMTANAEIYKKIISDLKEDKKKSYEIIFEKDNQIKNLIEAQKQTQNLLDQQQRLALQDKKLLEEYKSEINELKALKMPKEDMKEDSSIRGEAQEEIERLKAQLKLSEEERNKAKEKEPVKTESKKWWQLWK
ncbi:MarR family transcriptional regulator [Lactococcus garvieae]|uniref:MarR family transcriptional regulator n=1 Tax=Lactococcus garvieae TaxID=1363 RepID=UPI00254AAA3E|nr:HTH domain-containing protein [Lactococcus garvieae]